MPQCSPRPAVSAVWIFAVRLALMAPECIGQPTGPLSGSTLRFAECWALLGERQFVACAACVERQVPQDDTGFEALALRAAAARGTDDLETAKRYALQALRHPGAKDADRRTITWVHRTLGQVAYDQGDYQKGLEHYREVLAYNIPFDGPKSVVIGIAHYNIGNCFWGMDQRDSCKLHYGLALTTWGMADPESVPVSGYIHEVLGTYAWDEGDERGALEHFNLAAAKQLRDASDQDDADRMTEAAEAEVVNGRADMAIGLYERALEFRVGNYGRTHPNTACMHSDIARMLLLMDRPRAALRRVQEAIALFVPGFMPTDDLENPTSVDSTSSERLLLDALLLKFRLLRALPVEDRVASSTDQLIDLALALLDKLRTGAGTESSKLFWTTHVRAFLEDAMEHCHSRFSTTKDAASIDRALNIMEMSRNALLADAMRSLDARSNSGLPQALADEERTLKDHIASMRRYILLEEKKCSRMDVDKVGLWRKAVAAAEADLDLLVDHICTEHPVYRELKYRTPPLHADELNVRLGPDRSLLCMFQGEAASWFLLIDARGAQFIMDTNTVRISASLRALREQLSDRGRSLGDPAASCEAFAQSARFLYQVVFGNFAPQPIDHVTIVPDGAFQYLPFEVLLTGEAVEVRDYAALPYLIRTHTISYSPMIRSLLRDRAHMVGAGAYLGVAPRYSAATSTGLVPLRTSAEEVGAVRSLLGGEALLDAAATENALKRMIGEAGILHLAMHTVRDDVEPMFTSLAFADKDSTDDGRLDMYELFNLRLRAQLAVLSACRTGDGREVHGEGIMSLARAFAHAGCPSTVMSLWNCDDEATRSIVTGFFQRVNDGAALDDALREAKLDQLGNSDPMKAHPYYWSALVLMGDERAIEVSQPWYRHAWVWILFAAAILLFTFRSRLRK